MRNEAAMASAGPLAAPAERWDWTTLGEPARQPDTHAQLRAALAEELRSELAGQLLEQLRPYVLDLIAARVRQEVATQLSACKLQFAEILRGQAQSAARTLAVLHARPLPDCGAAALQVGLAELRAAQSSQREELTNLRAEVEAMRAAPRADPSESCTGGPRRADDSLLADLRELERCLGRTERPLRSQNTLFGDAGPPTRTPRKGDVSSAAEERETLPGRSGRAAAGRGGSDRCTTLRVRQTCPGELPNATRGSSSRPEPSVSRTTSNITKLQDLSTNLRARPTLIASAAPAASPDDSIIKYVNDVRQSRAEAERRELEHSVSGEGARGSVAG